MYFCNFCKSNSAPVLSTFNLQKVPQGLAVAVSFIQPNSYMWCNIKYGKMSLCFHCNTDLNSDQGKEYDCRFLLFRKNIDKMPDISEVDKSMEIYSVHGNYTYHKTETQECENNENLCNGSEEIQSTTDSAVKKPDKDTTFCVVNEYPDNTDEEAFLNQDDQETLTGYETVIFNFEFTLFETIF